MQTAAGRSLLGDRRELVRLSAEKLKRWGITQAQIDEILKEGQDRLHDPDPRADRRHLSSRRTSSRGRRCRRASRCSRSPTCSHVWVQAQVFEHQVGLVREGQAVEATVEAFPGRTFPGQGGVHPADTRPGDPHGRGPVRPGEPGPSAPARHVRHGDAEDPVADTPAFRTRARRDASARGSGGPHGRPDRRTSRRTAPSPTPSSARWATRSRSRSRGGRSGPAAAPARPS